MKNVAAGTERDRSKADTAQRIVVAAFELLRDSPDTPFSHEVVAAKAGVSARTAYRHFVTQDELVSAVWRHLRDTTGTRWPTSEGDIIPFICELFEQFERNSALTRAMVAAAPRANVSTHGSIEGRAAFRQAVQDLTQHWPTVAADQLVATCVAIYSAPFWVMLRDRGQLEQHHAVEAACHAMQAVLDAARRQPSGPSPLPAGSEP